MQRALYHSAAACVAAFFLLTQPLQAAQVSLAWDPPPELDIAGYKVSFTPITGGSTTTLVLGNTLTTTVAGLADGVRYRFHVTAFSFAGLESQPSNFVTNSIASNLAPSANPSSPTTPENTPLAITLTGTDPESTPLTFQVLTLTTNGTLSGTAPNLTYTPRSGFFGSDGFTFTVFDGTNVSSAASVSITVTFVNDPPVLSGLGPNRTGSADRTLSIPFTVADDRTTLSLLGFIATSDNPALILNGGIAVSGSGANRSLDITPLAGQAGNAVVSLSVSDADGGTNTVAFTVSIVFNQAPIISTIGPRSTAEDVPTGPITFTLSDDRTSAEFISLTATSNVPSLVASFTFGGSGSNRTLVLTPGLNQHGSAAITLQASDGEGGIASAVFDFTVTPINDPPAVSGLVDLVAREGLPGAGDFSVTDPDTDLSLIRFSATSSDEEIVASTGVSVLGSGTERTVVVTPTGAKAGVVTITLTVSDGTASTVVLFQVAVDPLDQAPVFPAIADVTGFENSRVRIPFEVADPDTPEFLLSFSVLTSNQDLLPFARIALDRDTHGYFLVGEPLPNATGQTTITVIVSDQTTSRSRSFLVTILPRDEPPTITAIPHQTVPTGGSVTSAFAVSDDVTPVDSLILRASSDFTSIIADEGIRFSGTGGSRQITIAPNPHAVGVAQITVTVMDGGRQTASTSFLVDVQPANGNPEISTIAPVVMRENPPFTPIPFLLVDPDDSPDLLDITVTSSNPRLLPPANVLFSGSESTRNLLIRPVLHQSGIAEVSLKVTDPKGGTTLTTFSLTVQPSARPDLNGDQLPDVLFQHVDGSLAAWVTGGDFGLTPFSPAHPGDANWRLVGSADFNGDRDSDLVFQHPTGLLSFWILDGQSLIRTQSPTPARTDSPAEVLRALADLDDNGLSDLVFQEPGGKVSAWLMDGTSRRSRQPFNPESPGGPEWLLVASGDFDRDSRPDLLFQHTDGTLGIWRLDGTTVISNETINPPVPPTGWIAVAVEDYDRDGWMDILFQNSQGQLSVWYLRGYTRRAASLFSPLSFGDWRAVRAH